MEWRINGRNEGGRDKGREKEENNLKADEKSERRVTKRADGLAMNNSAWSQLRRLCLPSAYL